MLLKGIDTIEYGIEVENYFETFNSMLNLFSTLKQHAQDTSTEQELYINGLNLKVHRNGVPFYSFKLSCKDFIICFMDKKVGNNPPIKVRFLSNFLWSLGFNKSLSSFNDWISYFELNITNTKVSRVDICADSDEIEFLEEDLNGLVTRAKGKTKHYVDDKYFSGKKFSGFTVGRGNPLLARIYNKSLEIKSSQKLWFHDIWEENMWNSDSDVWRVEFQIRRKALKEFGISSIEDLIKKEKEIWLYLTKKWLSFKSPSFDNNQSRWKLTTKWTVIQNADYMEGVSEAIRHKVIIGNTPQMLDQISGLLISVGSLNKHSDLEETLEVAKSWTEIKLSHKETTFAEESKKRLSRFYQSD
ncbi:replication initiation factor [Oceanobacillus kimchii]|uniref:replication initiation factor n=1 Tax=Oceanobacillus kimchii TaxID=746691 RepID=UPI003C75E33E